MAKRKINCHRTPEYAPTLGQQHAPHVRWLRLIADFSEAETAEILGISTGSVKTHLHHARERMQELLHKDGATWEEEVR